MTGLLSSAGIGTPAPDFELISADGRRVSPAELSGQPAVFAFSPQDWDPSRPHQLAHFTALVAQVPGHDVEIPVFGDLDSRGEVAAMFGIYGEQAVFVLDAHGIIRWRHLGALGTADTHALSAALAAMGNAVLPQARSERSRTERAKRAGVGTNGGGQTRREFIVSALAAAIIIAATPALAKAESAAKKLAALEPDAAALPITLNVNGRDVALTIEPRVTLLDALREYAGVTGTKKGCDHGQCGACTVHINGRRQLSCLTFAAMHQGEKITTVEGLANGDTLHPMQAAFIKHDGFQCGYCTPGQLMSATAILNEPCGSADADVKECMSGNICRCGAYPGIVAAIQEVRTTARG